MIKILELRRATPQALKDINHLLPQLSKTAKPLSLKRLETIMEDKNICLLVAKDGSKIVGMGTLALINATYGSLATIEDVVVDEGYRGKKIGEKISRKLVAITKQKKIRRLGLTSSRHRKAAHKLYRKIGFEKMDSDVFRYPFEF